MTTLPYARDHTQLYAGFWRRFAAYLIDAVILALAYGVLFALLSQVGILLPADPRQGGTRWLLEVMISLATLLIGWWLYNAGLEASSWQGSIGKRLLGLQVVDANGRRLGFARASGRHLAAFLSSLTGLAFYFGYWMCGLTDRKQALHDLIASAYVVRRGVPLSMPSGGHRPTPAGLPVWAIALIVFGGVMLFAMVPIAFFAAIAVPAYQDYVLRAQVDQAVLRSSALRVELVAFVDEHGRLPADLQELGFAPADLIDAQSAIRVQEGNVLIEFRDPRLVSPDGTQLALALYRLTDGGVLWICGHDRPPDGAERLSGQAADRLTRMPERYLPAHCRAPR